MEEEPYLLELVRYLHLNPLRAGVVPDLRQLDRYPWTGHSALIGTVPRPWQATPGVLGHFGPSRRRARQAYRAFVAAGLPQGRRPDLQGGAGSSGVSGAGPLWPPSAEGGRPTWAMSGFYGAASSWSTSASRSKPSSRPAPAACPSRACSGGYADRWGSPPPCCRAGVDGRPSPAPGRGSPTSG